MNGKLMLELITSNFTLFHLRSNKKTTCRLCGLKVCRYGYGDVYTQSYLIYLLSFHEVILRFLLRSPNHYFYVCCTCVHGMRSGGEWGKPTKGETATLQIYVLIHQCNNSLITAFKYVINTVCPILHIRHLYNLLYLQNSRYVVYRLCTLCTHLLYISYIL
jgi:hypothetical protein